MNRIAVRSLALAVLLTTAILLAGCGDSKDESKSSGANDATAAGRLTHVDGAIKLDGDTLKLTPSSGDDVMTFKLGPEVQSGTVQALMAANSRARIFYDSAATDGPVLAVSVFAAPTAGQGAKTYDGKITDLSGSSITVDGPDGERTFMIKPKDLSAFDMPHLEEHKSEKSPVRIYYRGTGADANAVAYEDA